MLFCIYISSQLSAFADDLKLCGYPGTSIQHDINLIGAWARWATDNMMEFNTDKCGVMHFGLKNARESYELNGKILTSKASERDLGILVDDRLNFKNHLFSLRKSCYRLINILFEGELTRDGEKAKEVRQETRRVARRARERETCHETRETADR